jgi:LacI family transcriptional regulator/LacI family repressor for deo operon, udp, cdd, tsx, nupC, and nupG
MPAQPDESLAAERPVSIRDIAARAGVSHTTVSRALHDNPLISRDVRERIRLIALEMGYVPNEVAQSLKQSQTHTVGLVVTSIADPFVGRVVRGIEEGAQAAHMSVILSVSDNLPEQEMAVIENFNRRRVDGIIIAASQLAFPDLQRLVKWPVPVVLINQQSEASASGLTSVAIDDFAGAKLAVEHLLGLGHRRIGYLGAGNRPRSDRLRQAGYQAALREAQVEANRDWVCITNREHRYHSDDVADGQELLEPLLDSGISALLCYNDSIAIGALLACRRLGVGVPQDLSIVGFDNIETSQYITPALTSVHQPKLRLGQLAMEMLLNRLAGRAVDNQLLATELIVRESTAAPKAAF